MSLILADVNVFVGGGTVIQGAEVHVEDGVIRGISTGGTVASGECERIECRGGWLLPGLIDAHVHFCLDGSPDPISAVAEQSPAVLALLAARHAEATLLAGFTTVRDMGEAHDIVFGLKQASAKGLIRAPRILNSGRFICMTGGHGWPMGREADGPDEVRKSSREQIKAGADVVKLMATGGVLTAGVQPGSAQLTREELAAGVEEAHKAGRASATHAQGREGIMNAVLAEIDSVEHGFQITEEIAAEMVERGTWFVPTLSTLANIEAAGAKGGIPDFVLRKTEQAKADFIESVKRARRLGIRRRSWPGRWRPRRRWKGSGTSSAWTAPSMSNTSATSGGWPGSTWADPPVPRGRWRRRSRPACRTPLS